MQILFVAGFSPIVRDSDTARDFYADALGVAFEGMAGDYPFTEKLGGVKHMGLWPLSEAAEACFGTTDWPDAIPVPQATLEFEVESPAAVADAAEHLRARGFRVIHDARTEPWTQTITRVLTPEGLLIGVCYTPWFHEQRAASDDEGQSR